MAAILSPSAKQQFFTDAGLPAAGYKLYTYAANTTTPQATYTDRAGAVANSNPIILNARGEATIYLTPGIMYDYRFVSPDGSQVWTQEDVSADAGDAAAVTFLQRGTGAVLRSLQDKGRDTLSVKDYGAVGDGVANDTVAIQRALDAADAGVYFPAGIYKIAGNLAISDKTLTLYGDGPGLSMIRQSTSGGIVFTASAASNEDMKNLNIYGIRFQAGAANCGQAITIMLTGGSGYAGVGPTFSNVEIVPQQNGYYWTKGVRGTNVRNARFSRVTVGSNAITGQTTHGFHFDGEDDPVELWFEDFCYLYVLTTGILIEGTYEGIYLHGINMTTVQDGLKWYGQGAQPVLHAVDNYFNCRRVCIDLDMISYMKVHNNSFSSTGIGTGSFYGVQINRTTGSQVNAGLVSGNTFIGGNGYTGGDTENGVRILSGNGIRISDNVFYNLTAGVVLAGGNGNRACDNDFYTVTIPVSAIAARRSAQERPEVFLYAVPSGTQVVPPNVDEKLAFGTEGYDYDDYFETANSRWTPPAGFYRVSVGALFTTGIADGDDLNLIAKRTGVQVFASTTTAAKAGSVCANLTFDVWMSGSDYLEIWANIAGSAGNKTKSASPSFNYITASVVR